MPAKKKKCSQSSGKQPCLRMTQVTKDKIAAGMRAYHARCRACNAHKKVDAAIASKRVATRKKKRRVTQVLPKKKKKKKRRVALTQVKKKRSAPMLGTGGLTDGQVRYKNTLRSLEARASALDRNFSGYAW